MESGTEEVSDIESKSKPKPSSKKAIKIIVLIIVLLIIIGLILDLVLVYLAAQDVDVSPKEIESVKQITGIEYEISFKLILENPSTINIQVEKTRYNIYIEDDFIGNGEKTEFLIKPGKNDYSFSMQFNIMDLAIAVRDQLLSSSVEIKVMGDIIIPVEFLRSIKVGEVTGEFQMTEDIGVD
jgi:LEA14-like dessication related protein